MLVILWLLAGWARADDSLRVHFIDVGHGDCIFIQTPDDGNPRNETRQGLRILIDAGESRYNRNWPVKYLKQLGLKRGDRIDYVVATHLDADHVGGLPMIYDTFHVLNTVEPGYDHPTRPARAFRAAACRESLEGTTYWRDPVKSGLIPRLGGRLNLGSELDARLLFYSANPGHGKGDTRTNFSSIILRIRYGAASFLFMGDAPRVVEESLLRLYPRSLLASTVLKVGHHGSATASSKRFVRAAVPRYAVICAGLRHGLPKAATIALLADSCGAEVWRTDDHDGEEKKNARTAAGDDNIVITTSGKKNGVSVRWKE
ncbi:MBL fold metallo-hydrolase [candidate division WOR-3 bacterium]|nr:MBL fold metallo-hydrolase [candidate division WOR-3 bacterium]